LPQLPADFSRADIYADHDCCSYSSTPASCSGSWSRATRRTRSSAVRCERSGAEGDILVTAAQCAAEFWNVCTRPTTARGGFGLSIPEAGRRLRVLEGLFHIRPTRRLPTGPGGATHRPRGQGRSSA
jgi:hypothetical protein